MLDQHDGDVQSDRRFDQRRDADLVLETACGFVEQHELARRERARKLHLLLRAAQRRHNLVRHPAKPEQIECLMRDHAGPTLFPADPSAGATRSSPSRTRDACDSAHQEVVQHRHAAEELDVGNVRAHDARAHPVGGESLRSVHPLKRMRFLRPILKAACQAIEQRALAGAVSR